MTATKHSHACAKGGLPWGSVCRVFRPSLTDPSRCINDAHAEVCHYGG
jgi:hypothetical protein